MRSIKESEDPVPTGDVRIRFSSESDVNESISESGFERVDVPRVTIVTRGSSAQSSGRV